MFRLITLAGPIGLVAFGIAVALIVGYLCGARGRRLLLLAGLALPLSFIGILIHDLMNLQIGLSPLASTMTVVATTTGSVSGLVTSLFLIDTSED